MSDEREYVLGTGDVELERLWFQHAVWIERAYALWTRAGIRAGMHVVDLGAGPGTTTFELATLVGPSGRVVAREVSERFLDVLGAEAARRGLEHVEPSPGPVEELDLPPASVDAAYARWLFCWLPDPAAALRRVAGALRPGGVVVLQEYLHWAAMRLVPRDPAHDRVVAACMRSWAESGGTIDVAGRVDELAEAAGLVVEHLAPVARVGAVGSLEWRWIGGFFASYLPRLVERGLLGADELAAFRAEWDRREAAGEGRVLAPLMADVVLRKP